MKGILPEKTLGALFIGRSPSFMIVYGLVKQLAGEISKQDSPSIGRRLYLVHQIGERCTSIRLETRRNCRDIQEKVRLKDDQLRKVGILLLTGMNQIQLGMRSQKLLQIAPVSKEIRSSIIHPDKLGRFIRCLTINIMLIPAIHNQTDITIGQRADRLLIDICLRQSACQFVRNFNLINPAYKLGQRL